MDATIWQAAFAFVACTGILYLLGWYFKRQDKAPTKEPDQ